ncbi:MAG: hypothetical protein U0401_28460 [Anaerolineae bacterium]
MDRLPPLRPKPENQPNQPKPLPRLRLGQPAATEESGGDKQPLLTAGSDEVFRIWR